jgi:hypothetical protein
MIAVTFNGREVRAVTIEEFCTALDQFDRYPEFELWLSAENGIAVSMLRNNESAFLMYLREPGDSGFVSCGTDSDDVVPYTLSNGQVDKYPKSWCIPLAQCYKALAFFFVNEGARPEWVTWTEN